MSHRDPKVRLISFTFLYFDYYCIKIHLLFKVYTNYIFLFITLVLINVLLLILVFIIIFYLIFNQDLIHVSVLHTKKSLHYKFISNIFVYRIIVLYNFTIERFIITLIIIHLLYCYKYNMHTCFILI